jgi:lipopolysaccharide biosynthesis protein
MDIRAQFLINSTKGQDYEADLEFTPAMEDPLVRLIAYYLPQFYPIPENDLWWGRGFTEWSNVTKTLPRFSGHYQPHLPGGLGFYDLRLIETLKAQAILAKKYGLAGFCFHHYWFKGKTLLDTPIKTLLSNPDIDIGFCVNWANGSWTRRWDGKDKEVLISQSYSDEDDLAFAESLRPFFEDKRYIRINGRPLFMVYNPGEMPDTALTIKRWRSYFAKTGVADPYIVMPQAFDNNDPRKYGFDAAAGFPPHNGGWRLPDIKSSLRPFKPWSRETVVQYDALMNNAVLNNPEEFTLLPGVCPSWDNSPRREDGGTCFLGASPKKYGSWLEKACRAVLRNTNKDERIVFINAWNEWAEGAHLEPDIHYGYAYLAETSRVLQRVQSSTTGIEKRRPFLSIQTEIFHNYEKRSFLQRVLRRALLTIADIFEFFEVVFRSFGETFR